MVKYGTIETVLCLFYRYRNQPDFVRLSVRLMQFYVISFSDEYHDIILFFPPSSLPRIFAVLYQYNTESDFLLSPAPEIYSLLSLLSRHGIISLPF